MRVMKWLKKSGMQVNDAKTSLCLFYKKDTTPIKVRVNNEIITSTKSINVLGVIFDQKLQWSDHIALCISKSSKKEPNKFIDINYGDVMAQIFVAFDSELICERSQ